MISMKRREQSSGARGSMVQTGAGGLSRVIPLRGLKGGDSALHLGHDVLGRRSGTGDGPEAGTGLAVGGADVSIVRERQSGGGSGREAGGEVAREGC